MRSFVAIPLPEPLLDALERLQRTIPAGRLSSRNTLHLTLAFVGEHPQAAIEALHDELSLIDLPSMEIRLAGLSTFGKRSPSVLFADVVGTPGLSALHQSVRAAMRRAGLPIPRERYRPHVTLARFAPGLSTETSDRILAFVGENAGFRASAFFPDDFVLYESILRPEGAIHEELARYPLKAER